jgi:hypothetical protein
VAPADLNSYSFNRLAIVEVCFRCTGSEKLETIDHRWMTGSDFLAPVAKVGFSRNSMSAFDFPLDLSRFH